MFGTDASLNNQGSQKEQTIDGKLPKNISRIVTKPGVIYQTRVFFFCVLSETEMTRTFRNRYLKRLQLNSLNSFFCFLFKSTGSFYLLLDRRRMYLFQLVVSECFQACLSKEQRFPSVTVSSFSFDAFGIEKKTNFFGNEVLYGRKIGHRSC